MSYFDDPDKDNLLDVIRKFLKSHTIHDLMIIVTYAVEDKENNWL